MLQVATDERERFAAAVAEQLSAHGRAHVLYEPGDATHYEFGIVRVGGLPVVHCGVEGNGPVRANARSNDWVMFDPDNHRAMYVDLRAATHPQRFIEHWSNNEWSAAVLGELLTMIAKCDPTPIRRAYPHIFGG